MTRLGFVSNSSSSSFIVSLNNLTPSQVAKILKPDYTTQHCGIVEGFPYKWDIEINEANGWIEGYTPMNNFDMGQYFELLEIPEEYVRFTKV